MDSVTAPMFRTELFNLLAPDDPLVVLDLVGVAFCDSGGLNALLAMRRRAQETGTTLALARVQPQPRRLLELTGVDEIFTVCDSVEAAQQALGN
jgi:anti-anti-sigma factor